MSPLPALWPPQENTEVEYRHHPLKKWHGYNLKWVVGWDGIKICCTMTKIGKVTLVWFYFKFMDRNHIWKFGSLELNRNMQETWSEHKCIEGIILDCYILLSVANWIQRELSISFKICYNTKSCKLMCCFITLLYHRGSYHIFGC